MKSIAFTFLACAICVAASAQELKSVATEYNPVTPCKSDVKPISNSAFDKYLTDHFSYTILGSTAPATGLKLETASPSISLKGTLAKSKSNDEILTLELQAGADSKLMQVFSDNKLSTYFKATAGYSVLLGRFGFKKLAIFNYANYDIPNQYLLCHFRTAGVVKYNELVRQGQKTNVMKAMIGQDFMTTPTAEELEKLLNDPLLKVAGKPSLLEELANEVMTDYGMKIAAGTKLDVSLALFAGYWTAYQTSTDDKIKFLKQFDKQVAIQKNAVDSLFRYEIAQVKTAYTQKFVWWFNGSPFISNTNFKEFTRAPDTLVDKSSFLYGAKLSLNFFWKYRNPHQFWYITAGIAPQKINSLDEMTKYSYKKSTAFKIPDPKDPATSEAISKEETGSGYQGSFQSGFGMEYYAESYLVPWSAAYVPGFYGKFSFSHSSHRINQNRTAVYLGLVWNLTNGEKDAKNLLSIVPYAGWSNLNKQQYTDGVKTGNMPLHDLFTAGIQVGIPINIGK